VIEQQERRRDRRSNLRQSVPASRLVRPLLVGVLLIAALAIRLAVVDGAAYRATHDAGTYNKLASEIAQHGDYWTRRLHNGGAGGSEGPTAYFPPGYSYLLAGVDLIDGHQAGGKTAVAPERISQAVLGTVTVGLVGLVAMEAFGPVVGMFALALAAFYPVLIELSSILVAENLMVALELAAVWAMLRARRSRHPYVWIAASGVFTGLASLTHENAALLVIPLGFGAWALRRRAAGAAPVAPDGSNREPAGPAARAAPASGRRALLAPAVLVVLTAVTIAPWTIRNEAQLHRFLPISDETGITLRGTYNPESAAFEPVPYKWRFFYKIPQDQKIRQQAGQLAEPELGDRLQTQALNYISAHPTAPLEVAYHNTLRLFELEGTYAWQASAAAVDLPESTAKVGVICFWILCGLALLGAFTRVVRRGPGWLWAIPLLLALSVVFVNVETPRFREPIDPFLILLAACGLASAAQRIGLGARPVRDRDLTAGVAGDSQPVEMVQRLP
jgi:Dolichyl-phosphate-mannose-protein mannosyltransferase